MAASLPVMLSLKGLLTLNCSSRFKTLSKHVLEIMSTTLTLLHTHILEKFPRTIKVSISVNIKYKSYFKISIIENAICLPAKVNPLGTFSVVVDIRST